MSATGNANPNGKPVRGRPKKFIDLELVEKLAHIQCTHAEIAATLGVSIDTLQRNKDYAAVVKRGAEGGRKSLRRMQFESANRGNVVMQIWLGKQYLGQTDHQVTEVRQLPSLGQLSSAELSAVLNEYVTAQPAIAAEIAAIDVDFAIEYPQFAKPAALADRPQQAGANTDSDHN